MYAERVQRMFGMVADLLHEKEGSEAYLKLYNRIEKYEQICDRMELEIAGFLNLVVGGRLSYEGKMMVNSMLTIVTEIESIGDCCYNLRIIKSVRLIIIGINCAGLMSKTSIINITNTNREYTIWI